MKTIARTKLRWEFVKINTNLRGARAKVAARLDAGWEPFALDNGVLALRRQRTVRIKPEQS